MSDITSVNDNAMRDSAAICAALYRGDADSAELLLRFYADQPDAQAALCGSLAAFATATLQTIDNIRERFNVTDGVILPSGNDVLKSVLMKLAEN